MPEPIQCPLDGDELTEASREATERNDNAARQNMTRRHSGLPPERSHFIGRIGERQVERMLGDTTLTIDTPDNTFEGYAAYRHDLDIVQRWHIGVKTSDLARGHHPDQLYTVKGRPGEGGHVLGNPHAVVFCEAAPEGGVCVVLGWNYTYEIRDCTIWTRGESRAYRVPIERMRPLAELVHKLTVPAP